MTRRSDLTAARHRAVSTLPAYDVGYGKPPLQTRFRKGHSGNPRGRPKGSKNVGDLLDEALDETVGLTESDGMRTITKRRGMLMSMIAKAIRGDVRAAGLIVKLIETNERDAGRKRDASGRAIHELSDEELTEIILADRQKSQAAAEEFTAKITALAARHGAASASDPVVSGVAKVKR